MNQICGDQFEAHSAGLEPGTLNPLVVEAMSEVGIDISHKGTQRVFDVWKSGPVFAYVVTVCDESSAEKCPIFPGPTRRLHWSFPDPSNADRNARRKAGRGARDPRRNSRPDRRVVRRSLLAGRNAMMDTLRPRLATVADAEEINAIYNYYVRTSAATFQVDDETTEERVEELRTRPGNQPLIVLEVDDAVVGWGALSPFRSRCAYRDTIELTVYVRHDCHRQGYGRVHGAGSDRAGAIIRLSHRSGCLLRRVGRDDSDAGFVRLQGGRAVV